MLFPISFSFSRWSYISFNFSCILHSYHFYRYPYCHLCSENMENDREDKTVGAVCKTYWKFCGNNELLQRAGIGNLRDTDSLAYKIHWSCSAPPNVKPVSLAINWTPDGGSKRKGRPKRTSQDTLKEELQAVGITETHDEVRSVARGHS